MAIKRHGEDVVRIVNERQTDLDQAGQERELNRMLEELRALQAQVKPAVEGYSDWKSLRDAGRQ